MIDALLRFIATRASTTDWGVMITTKLAASTLAKDFSQSYLDYMQVAFGHTGSQLNNFPLRRYDGVTLAKAGVSLDSAVAIEKAQWNEQDLLDSPSRGESRQG